MHVHGPASSGLIGKGKSDESRELYIESRRVIACCSLRSNGAGIIDEVDAAIAVMKSDLLLNARDDCERQIDEYEDVDLCAQGIRPTLLRDDRSMITAGDLNSNFAIKILPRREVLITTERAFFISES